MQKGNAVGTQQIWWHTYPIKPLWSFVFNEHSEGNDSANFPTLSSMTLQTPQSGALMKNRQRL